MVVRNTGITPESSGNMRILVDNPAALAVFEGKIEKAFYLDMIETPEPAKS